MVDQCIFGVILVVAVMAFVLVVIVALELCGIASCLKGITKALTCDLTKNTEEEHLGMAMQLALPYHGKKPAISGRYIFTTKGRVPVYSFRLVEDADAAYSIMETSEHCALLNAVYHWNQLVLSKTEGDET